MQEPIEMHPASFRGQESMSPAAQSATAALFAAASFLVCSLYGYSKWGGIGANCWWIAPFQSRCKSQATVLWIHLLMHFSQIASRKYLGFTLGNFTQPMKVCFPARNWSNPMGFSEVAAATKLSGPKEVRFDEIWTIEG